MRKHDIPLKKTFSEALEDLSQAMEDILTKSEYLQAASILYSIIESISKEKYEVSRLMFQGVFIECEKNERASIPILSNIIIKECEYILQIPVYKLKDDESYVCESLENTMSTIYERLNNPTSLRLSLNITDVILTENEFFLSMASLNECNLRILTNNDLTECIENLYIFTYLARHGIHKYKYTEELYKKLDCILASLSTCDKQMARDVAEEVMFSSEKDNEALFGYLILSSVYTSHKLHIESLIYNLSAIFHLKNRGSISQEFKFSKIVFFACAI